MNSTHRAKLELDRVRYAEARAWAIENLRRALGLLLDEKGLEASVARRLQELFCQTMDRSPAPSRLGSEPADEDWEDERGLADTEEQEADILRISSRRSAAPEEEDAMEEIERLYDEISFLSAQVETASEKPGIEEQIRSSFIRLRRLQEQEAARLRADFETSLAMPIDAGRKIVERIRSLRTELEDSISADSSAAKADSSQT